MSTLRATANAVVGLTPVVPPLPLQRHNGLVEFESLTAKLFIARRVSNRDISPALLEQVPRVPFNGIRVAVVSIATSQGAAVI